MGRCVRCAQYRLEVEVEMLKWAGRGVAMEGGESVVFEVCDDIAKDPNQDGVALYLENLLVNNQIGT